MTATIHTLDATGLTCPLPILKTRKAIAAMDSGELLEVKSTDPGSVKDIDSFCKQTGHELLTSEDTGNGFVFRIRKA